MKTCNVCDGTGTTSPPNTFPAPCPLCHGKGEILTPRDRVALWLAVLGICIPWLVLLGAGAMWVIS